MFFHLRGAEAEKIRRKIEMLREDRRAARSLGKDLEESVHLRSHAPGRGEGCSGKG